MIFWKKHLINILLFLLLLAVNFMCIFLPFFSIYLLFITVPLSAYFMHRYTPFVPPVITAVFAVASFVWQRNFMHLYFLLPTLIGQIGLFYGLKCQSFRRGVALSVLSIAISTVLSTVLFTAISSEKDFPILVKKEIMKGDGGFIDGNAKLFFDSRYPTESDKEEFRILDGSIPSENMDEELFNALYVFGNHIEALLRERLLSYMFAYSVLLGGGAYMLGMFLNKHYLLDVYFFRPRFPVLKEIEPDPTPIHEYSLPKKYLAVTLPPVLLIYLLTFAYEDLYPVHLALYQTLLIAPFALNGLCFMLSLAKLFPNKVLQNVASGVIILVAAMSAISAGLIYVFAVAGLADYLINFRRLFRKVLGIGDLK